MDQAELALLFALKNIEDIKEELVLLETQIKDGLKGLQERKPKRKRSKKDEG